MIELTDRQRKEIEVMAHVSYLHHAYGIFEAEKKATLSKLASVCSGRTRMENDVLLERLSEAIVKTKNCHNIQIERKQLYEDVPLYVVSSGIYYTLMRYESKSFSSFDQSRFESLIDFIGLNSDDSRQSIYDHIGAAIGTSSLFEQVGDSFEIIEFPQIFDLVISDTLYFSEFCPKGKELLAINPEEAREQKIFVDENKFHSTGFVNIAKFSDEAIDN